MDARNNKTSTLPYRGLSYGVLLSLTLSLTGACQSPIMGSTVPVEPSSSNPNSMMQSDDALPFSLQVSLTDVYEDQIVPPGTIPGRTRAVGHAVGRLRLENLTQTEVPLRIEAIAIYAADVDTPDPSVAIMSQSLGDMTLGGLQILDQGFHLTNEQGFGDVPEVKAIVTYALGDSTYTLESEPYQVVVNQ